MPTISKDRQELYKSRISAIVSVNHQLTNNEISELLERDGIHLDRDYLSKLPRKVYQERTKRADRQTLNYALAAFEDTMTEVVRVAWSIANDKTARKQDRVMALREVREAHKDVFEKLFDAGVFERKLGTLDNVIRNTPLAPERKQVIRDVFGNWGLLRPRNLMEEPPSQLQVHNEIDALFETFEARKESRKSLLGFSLVYLTGYFTDPPALFHPELIHALESEHDRRVLVLGFRGSGKSTFGSLALPLWEALEYPEKYPFIILVADSSRQGCRRQSLRQGCLA
jgi:hypothetical protein